MIASPDITRAEAMELRKRAEADMRNLGLDPGSDLDWKAYALGRLRQHEFVLGRRKPGRDDIIEIDKQTYAVIRRIADPSTRLIKALKDVNKKFPSIACLELIEKIWAPLAVSPWGGLPEPLRLVLADLVNVLEGRRGRLVSPEFSDPRMVTDSGRDRFRLVVKANAAAIVHRLIEGKLSCAAACRQVAKSVRVPRKFNGQFFQVQLGSLWVSPDRSCHLLHSLSPPCGPRQPYPVSCSRSWLAPSPRR